MIERLTDLEGRVQSARAALEGLAERASRLRARLEAAAEGPPDPEGTSLVVPDIDPAAPETSALASSLERLTQTAWARSSCSAAR